VLVINAVYVLLALLSRRRRRRDPARWRGAYDIFAGSVLMLIFDTMYAWLVIRMVTR